MTEYELREAMMEPGCPVCGVTQRALDTLYRWFVIETYSEAAMLVDLAEGGFCPYHAWEVAKVAGKRLSVTYEFLVAAELRRMQEVLDAAADAAQLRARRGSRLGRLLHWMRHGTKSPLEKAIKGLSPRRPCPVCRRIEEVEIYACTCLSRMLEDEETRNLLGQSDGLCLPHLRTALGHASHPAATFLAEDAVGRLDKLQEGFREYFRKQDYRYSDEPKGEEQHTWSRASDWFAGQTRRPPLLDGGPGDPRL
ncbi:MAG: DUF6062 family protein [Firmicutes bacterium]|nr:DUF6062 family protein [Bacillota bacterium]